MQNEHVGLLLKYQEFQEYYIKYGVLSTGPITAQATDYEASPERDCLQGEDEV